LSTAPPLARPCSIWPPPTWAGTSGARFPPPPWMLRSRRS
jgi:hypothetical protein